jgi:hypothetical protein
MSQSNYPTGRKFADQAFRRTSRPQLSTP